MGVSTNAILVYGIDLGEDIYAPDDATDEYGDELSTGEWLEKQAEEAGLEIVWHCSCDYPMYIVTDRKHYIARRGYPVEIDGEALALDNDEKLLAFARRFMSEPPPAKWILCSLWC